MNLYLKSPDSHPGFSIDSGAPLSPPPVTPSLSTPENCHTPVGTSDLQFVCLLLSQPKLSHNGIQRYK